MPADQPKVTVEAIANVGGERIPFPRWACWIEFGFVAAVAASTVAAAPADHRWLLAALLAVAISPWLAEGLGFDNVLGLAGANSAKIAVVLIPVGIAYIGAYPFSFAVGGGQDQSLLFIALWLVGEMVATGRPATALLTVVGTLGIALGRLATDPTYQSAGIWSAAVALSAGVGLVIRILVAALRQLEDAQSQLVETAAADERRRVAREVHDVIAHSLAVTMLHVTAARLAIGRSDPAGADEALDEAERAGRASLADIRRMVGLLREPDATGLTRAQPGARDVVALVEGYRAAGVDISFELCGEAATIDHTTGLALYRIVQESLANASKHAPGTPVQVRIDVEPSDIAVVVHNPVSQPATARGDGHGLVGIRERTEAMGGECAIGPGDGVWTVRCRLPLAPIPVNGAVGT